MKILYLEGFSSGPGLPYPLLNEYKNELIFSYMSYYWSDILMNPFFYLFFGFLFYLITIVFKLMNYQKLTLKNFFIYLILFIFLIYFEFYIKKLGFRWTIDKCIDGINKDIIKYQPDVIIGYSWGGGIATQLIERKYWKGHTILIAPASKLLSYHSGYDLPSLKLVNSFQNKHVFIIQGTSDSVVPHQDNLELYQTAKNEWENTPNSKVHFLEAKNFDHSLYGYVTRSLFKDIFELIEKENEKNNNSN